MKYSYFVYRIGWFKVTAHNTDKIVVIGKAEGITDAIQKGKSMHMFTKTQHHVYACPYMYVKCIEICRYD